MTTCMDIILDILKCIEVNEIEKCQLVNNHWRNLIDSTHEHLKQRRRVYELFIDFGMILKESHRFPPSLVGILTMNR